VASFKSQLFYLLVKKQGLAEKNSFIHLEIPQDTKVAHKDLFQLPLEVQITKETIGGVTCEVITPTLQLSEGMVIYVHGEIGGIDSLSSRRYIAAQIALRSGVRVVFFHYRSIENHPYPVALKDLYDVYSGLENSYGGAQISISGDSFGAGMAIALAMKLRDEERRQPTSLALISPWTDLSLSNESHRRNLRLDAFFLNKKTQIEKFAGTYAHFEKIVHPFISPQFADLNGLPPTLIHAGDHEILYDDARVLAQKMLLQSCDVKLRVFSGMWHLWQSFCGYFEEATDSINELSKFIRAKHAQSSRETHIND
jgi:monoterpene epsilon-lactone hydrolase